MVHWSSRGRFHGIRWSPPLEFSFPGIRRSLFVGALRGRVLPLPATMRTCESHVPVRAAGVCALVRWSSLGIRAPGLRLEFSRDSVEPSCPGPPSPVPPGFIRRSWFTGAHIEIRRGGWSSLCGSVGHSLEPVEPSRCSGAGHWSSLCVLARWLGLIVIRWPFAASVEQGQAAAFPV